MNGELRDRLRLLRDQQARQSIAWEHRCVGCGEPLPTDRGVTRKFCTKECNGKYYWRAGRAKRAAAT